MQVDVNNDGVEDFIVSATAVPARIGILVQPNQIKSNTFIVFGGQGIGSTTSFDISSFDSRNGFIIQEDQAGASLGISVSAAGDVNNNGIDDVIIGANRAGLGGRRNAGKSYVLFGASNVGASGFFTPSDIDGSNGFVICSINGIFILNEGDSSGTSVSGVGDINGDAVDDILIGAPSADPGGRSDVGTVYAVFGRSGLGDDRLSGNRGLDILSGGAGDDVLRGNNGDDRLVVDDGDDTMVGGAGRDTSSRVGGIDTADGCELILSSSSQ